MLILAFDTSSSRASACLCQGTRELASAQGAGRARHGDTLLPLVRQVLEQAKVEPVALELLVVGTGPGSFTGLRVGLAVAKGLALGLRCPLVGVISPVALALAAAPQVGLVATATRAYRGEVYAGMLRVEERRATAVLELFAAAPVEAMARLESAAAGDSFACVGDGFSEGLIAELPDSARRVDAALDSPSALVLAREGLRLFSERGADTAAALVPRYVRGADAQLPRVPQKLS